MIEGRRVSDEFPLLEVTGDFLVRANLQGADLGDDSLRWANLV